MSIGITVSLGITLYVSMFLLTYLVTAIYMRIHENRIVREYGTENINLAQWGTVIFWPVTIPIWFLIFISVGFFKSCGGIFGYLDDLSVLIASKFVK